MMLKFKRWPFGKSHENSGSTQASTKPEVSASVKTSPDRDGAAIDQHIPHTDLLSRPAACDTVCRPQRGLSRNMNDHRPYIPECEVFEEGGPEAGERIRSCGCLKHFIPVNKFTQDHLPEEYRDELGKIMRNIECRIKRTVKLRVRGVSVNRPDTYPDSMAPYPYAEYKGLKVGMAGTGTLYQDTPKVIDKQCPCHACKKTENPMKKYFAVNVLTAAHVVFDDTEAERTVCELFYDDPKNRKNVKLLYGVKRVDKECRSEYDWDDWFDVNNLQERSENDLFHLVCVSHDMELYKKLKSILEGFNLIEIIGNNAAPIIVSHPHGFSKQISIGTYQELLIEFSINAPFTIPVGTQILSQLDLTSEYPEFFVRPDPELSAKIPYIYSNVQPIQLYIPCNESQTTALKWGKRITDPVTLPKDSKMTSMDGTTIFPAESIKFRPPRFFEIIKHNVASHYIVYDTPTCNGSSGAVLQPGFYYPDLLPCHFGKLPNGVNRTGTYKKWLVKKIVKK